MSKNGILLLNISPKADGTIPDAQQTALLELGKWLGINGEAIYGTHAWTKFGEGGERGSTAPNVRFTVKGDSLYAIILGAYPSEPIITSITEGEVTGISMLGSADKVEFTQDQQGLRVKLPATPPCQYGYVLKISGLKMNPTLNTASGNPE